MPFARSERVALVPIFYFIKNQSPAPLFLLFRKRSRSHRLTACKRAVFTPICSLPTFCGFESISKLFAGISFVASLQTESGRVFAFRLGFLFCFCIREVSLAFNNIRDLHRFTSIHPYIKPAKYLLPVAAGYPLYDYAELYLCLFCLDKTQHKNQKCNTNSNKIYVFKNKGENFSSQALLYIYSFFQFLN